MWRILKWLSMLVERRHQRFRWIYALASLLFFLVALVGVEYGAFWGYFFCAGLLLVHMCYPTFVLWALFTGIWCVITIVYCGMAVLDVLRIVQGDAPHVFLDGDDSLMFLVLLALCIGITWIQLRHRPVRRTQTGY
jgi:hypothetical protein